MELRKLTVKDLYTVGGMIKRALPDLGSIELGARAGESAQAHAQRIGSTILPVLLDACYEDAWDWLADLVGMTRQELMDSPADIAVDIIDLLIKSEELPRFFGRVRALTVKQ